MKKIYLIIITLILVFSTLKSNASSEFAKMQNGDNSILGYGSVTEELKEYGIDTFTYQTGYKEDKALMMAESNTNLYLYVYKKSGYKEYDKVSIACYFGEPMNLDYSDLSWEDKSLKLVSYDVTNSLQKYLVEGLQMDSSNYHYICVREIYNSNKKTDSDFVFSVGFSYQFNPLTNTSKVDSEDVIRVTNKKVAYEVFPQNNEKVDYLHQRSYVAFSTSIKMDELIGIKLKYSGFDYSAYTNIKLNYSSNT